MSSPQPQRWSMARFRTVILAEVAHIQDFMYILMKQRNGAAWTREDRVLLKAHFARMARRIRFFGLFCLPGGALLAPLLAVFLERRKRQRHAATADATAEKAKN